MTRIAIDYLAESPLLDPQQIESEYAGLSDAQLVQELDGYRAYIADNQAGILQELSGGPLSVQLEHAQRIGPPSLQMVTRGALYLQRITLWDPLLERSLAATRLDNEAVGASLGVPLSASPSRSSIAAASEYIRSLRAAIGADYVKLAPLAGTDRYDQAIPLVIPEARIAMVPEAILEALTSETQLSAAVTLPDGAGLRVEPMPEGGYRRIGIEFGDHPSMSIQQLVNIADPRADGEGIGFRVPATDASEPIAPDEYRNWIQQVVPSVAAELWNNVAEQLLFASGNRCGFVTDSATIYRAMVAATIVPNETEQSTIDVALDLTLPYVQNLDLERAVDLRLNYGESLAAFRSRLGADVASLRAGNRTPSEAAIEAVRAQYRAEAAELRRALRREATYTALGLAATGVLLGLSVVPPASLLLGGLSFVGGAGRRFWDISASPTYILLQSERTALNSR